MLDRDKRHKAAPYKSTPCLHLDRTIRSMLDREGYIERNEAGKITSNITAQLRVWTLCHTISMHHHRHGDIRRTPVEECISNTETCIVRPPCRIRDIAEGTPTRSTEITAAAASRQSPLRVSHVVSAVHALSAHECRTSEKQIKCE